MIWFRQLRGAQPPAWLDAAAGLRRLAGVLCGHADAIAADSRSLPDCWRGAAALSAAGRLAGLGGELAGYPAPLLAADQILTEYAGRIAAAQRALAAAVERPGSSLVHVDPDGAIRVDRSAAKPDAADLAIAGGVERRITAALRLADAADAEAADRLRALLPGFATDAPAVAPDRVPAPGSPPREVRRWWDSLPPEQRRWLLARDPARVGALDGVPAAIRDQANRTALERSRRAMLARRAELAADPAGGPGVLVLDARLRGIEALRGRLARTDPDRAYLLGFDTGGDGRAVVSIRDPDRASHVATYLPGVGADLDSVGYLLGNAGRLAARAGRLAGENPRGIRPAVVLWLGYDAPDSVAAATSDSAARAAGPGLARFLDSLHASHEPRAGHDGPASFTVVGHSYGSTVAGEAARDHRLAVDDLVFVGSPGVGVRHAGDLGLPAGHVWSSTARWDPITLTGVVRDALGPPLPRLLHPDPADELWFGANPSRPEFGARRFATPAADPLTAHSAYFADGNPALDAIARIVIGDYGEVR